MLSTTRKPEAKPAPSAAPPAQDHLKDALRDTLITGGLETEVIEAGPKVESTQTRGDLNGEGDVDNDKYLPYPKQANKSVRGTSHHKVELDEWANGSALVANSNGSGGVTSDQFSMYDAYARYSEEHPDWTQERRLLMASREDVNRGGDVVSARRTDGGAHRKNGRKFGAVIGNSKYASMPTLGQVPADAAGMKSRWEGDGFAIGGFEDVDSGTINATLDMITAAAKPGDEVNLFFGGHGTRSSGLAGVNAAPAYDKDLGSWHTDSVDYGAIGILASSAVANGWHLTAIIDCCASGGVADAVMEQMEVDTKSSRSMDYDIDTDEIREKGLMVEQGRYKGQVMEEILYRQFTHSGGLAKYGKGMKK